MDGHDEQDGGGWWQRWGVGLAPLWSPRSDGGTGIPACAGLTGGGRRLDAVQRPLEEVKWE